MRDSNFVGVGVAPEGLADGINYAAYELLAESFSRDGDLGRDWIGDYAARRYGSAFSEKAAAAWRILAHSALNCCAVLANDSESFRFHGAKVALTRLPAPDKLGEKLWYARKDLLRAWDLMIEASTYG